MTALPVPARRRAAAARPPSLPHPPKRFLLGDFFRTGNSNPVQSLVNRVCKW